MNKNQKRIRAEIKNLAKAGKEQSYALEVPAGGYHNFTKGQWTTRRIPIGSQKRLSEKAKVARKGSKNQERAED